MLSIPMLSSKLSTSGVLLVRFHPQSSQKSLEKHEELLKRSHLGAGSGCAPAGELQELHATASEMIHTV